MTTIPARKFVNVIPNVLEANGTGLALNGLFLTQSARLPMDSLLFFASADDVGAYFGLLSEEKARADIYFGGFVGSDLTPAALGFFRHPDVAASPFLRGGKVSGLTLGALQALTGVLTLVVNGVSTTSGTINLSSATSFSSAAALIETGLNIADAVVTGSIAGTVLTVSAVTSGTLVVGQEISGSGVTAGTKIVSLGTGTGGTGTYNVSVSQTAGSTTIRAGALKVVYDSTSGAFQLNGGTPAASGTISFASGSLSAGLKLTAETGAVLSQGSAFRTPAETMQAAIGKSQAFVSFSTIFEPNTADKIAFAAWNHGQKNRYLYVCQDSDVTVISPSAITSAGYFIIQAAYSGTALLYAPAVSPLNAFVMAVAASLDFTRTNGRTTYAYRRAGGVSATVTDETSAANLEANGYNYFAAVGSATEDFTFFYPGQVTGEFAWIDSYVNQIWLNTGFQSDLLSLLMNVPAVPYNAEGYELIGAALSDRIEQAVNFGVIRAGVSLGASQVAQIKSAVGSDVSDVIFQQGWYLQVTDPPSSTRAARGSPPCSFYYTDGQAVHEINLASVQVQ